MNTLPITSPAGRITLLHSNLTSTFAHKHVQIIHPIRNNHSKQASKQRPYVRPETKKKQKKYSPCFQMRKKNSKKTQPLYAFPTQEKKKIRQTQINPPIPSVTLSVRSFIRRSIPYGNSLIRR
jgi:hypothetical protein